MTSQHPADVYNQKRRIIFSTYHKDPARAREYLENYKRVLGPPGYVGLKAELDFYEKRSAEFNLTLAADVGDSTDFTGQVGGDIFRFDVTTNETYKDLSTYEPFQTTGHKYKIAIVDKANGELIDLVDINFPICSSCGVHRLFDIALMLPEKKTLEDSVGSMTFDQVCVRFCPRCDYVVAGDRISTFGLMDVDGAAAEFFAAHQAVPGPAWTQKYMTDTLRYLRKALNGNIVGLAANRYVTTEPSSGDGYWETYLPYVRPLVSHLLPRELGELWPE